MAHDELAERRAEEALSQGSFDDALTQLMNAYGRDIFRFCLATLGQKDDAEDVTQTVFVQAHAALRGFRRGSTFRTWLYSIARNRCLDHLKVTRRRQARVQFTDDPPELTTSSDAPDASVSRVLRECLARLSEAARTAVLLRFKAGFSYAELAESTNERAGTLQARVARALPVLKGCLEEHGIAL